MNYFLRNLGEEPHYNLLEVDGIPNKMIKIEDANRATDRKAFKCVVLLKENRSNCSESAFFVRIRDKYAALWPFIGIVSEVVVICLIIFICERRRAATAKGVVHQILSPISNSESTNFFHEYLLDILFQLAN